MTSMNFEEAKADVKKGIKDAQAHAEALFGGKGLTDPVPTVEVSHSNLSASAAPACGLFDTTFRVAFLS
jgi:hypothetical protein